MSGGRGRRPEAVESPRPVSWEHLLETMPAWADAHIPADLVFDVNMRRRVLARVPGVLARESSRRARRALRLAAVAAAVLVLLGGFLVDLRAQVPPVVEEIPGYGAELRSAAAPVGGSAVEPAAGPPGAPAPGFAAARVRAVRVLGPARVAPEAAPDTVQARGLAEPAGLGAMPEVQEVKLAEPVAYAGTVSGQAVVAAGSGRVWRYVEGSLVGGESLLPRVAGPGSLVLLPGDGAPQALWIDAAGTVRLDGEQAPVGLTGVRRLSALPGATGPATVLAAGTQPRGEGYGVRLWLLTWQQGHLGARELNGPEDVSPADPNLLDLAAFRGERGLTVYLAVEAGGEVAYLGEGREGHLRWRRLMAPLFRSGTAVSSGEVLAGVDRTGAVAILEWIPRGGVAAWFRPGVYRIRRLAFPELGDAVRSVHFLDTDGAGQEGLLLVGEAGTVGYVDASLVSRR